MSIMTPCIDFVRVSQRIGVTYIYTGGLWRGS